MRAYHFLRSAKQASSEVRKQIVNKYFGGVSMDGTPGLVGSWQIMNTNENRNHENGNKNQALAPAECWRSVPKNGTADRWWAGLKPGERQLAHAVAIMMEELTGTKRIEIRKEGPEIRARFIYILKQPEKGCLSAVILPECDRATAN